MAFNSPCSNEAAHDADMTGSVELNRRTTLILQQESDANNAGYTPGVFLDVAAMKDRVRDALKKPVYNVQDYYSERGVWQWLAKSAGFEQITLLVIAVNAVWIAVDTDSNDADILLEAHVVFQLAENLFCLFFSFELFTRFMAFRSKRLCMRDTWFVFDSVLVFMMVIETWVMSLIVLLSDDGGSGGFGNASVLRIARLLRLSRMARMVRLLRIMPELMIMIKGMLAAIRSVFFTLLLLVIIMYVFGIAFTQLLSGTEIGNRYYSTVPESMYTLLIYGTLLDNIGSLTEEMGEESLLMTGVFLLFVLLAALTVMNMLIGVLCEVVSAVAATEKEEMLVTWVKSKIEKIFQEVDSDGSQTVTRKEFVGILENVSACRVLQDVGVDVVGLVDFADAIFEDEGDCEKELSFHEFMDVVLQLRGCNNATVKDIVDLRKLVQKIGSQSQAALLQIKRLAQAVESSRRTEITDVCKLPSERSVHSVSKLPSERSVHSYKYHNGLKPAYDGDRPQVRPNAVQCEPLEFLCIQQIQSPSNCVLPYGSTWETLATSAVSYSESTHASTLEITSPKSVVHPSNGIKAEVTSPTAAVLTSNGFGSGVIHKVQSANQSYESPNCIDLSSGESKTNGHDRVGSEEVKLQLKRLDDALQNLAGIRSSLSKCVLLDFGPEKIVGAGLVL